MKLSPYAPGRPDFSKLEEEVLEFWDETGAFQASLQNRADGEPYIFYDGPPFANGLPHYGHLLGSTSKDVVPRYQTMRGKYVKRVWGWDCHGVPIENAIEKELGLKGGKKGIEELGIGKFNAACRASIMAYDKEWKKTIRRLGRWVDFENAYKTMDTSFMESVWWGFSQLYEKGLVYQGRKVILYCPRCSTPLSNFEIAMDNSYRDVEDWSLTVKFKATGRMVDGKKLPSHGASRPDGETFFLAWTTTPWTLPGNVALAVDPAAQYVLILHTLAEGKKEYYWVAKDRLPFIAHQLQIEKPEIITTLLGEDLVGLSYEPLYSWTPLDGKTAYYVTSANFVSLEDGTGIVHTAAIFGEDDYALAIKLDLPCVPTLDDQGKFLPFVEQFAGQFYKKAEDSIIEDLFARGFVLQSHRFVHSYPFCYRCGTPLYYNALPAWFIDVGKLRDSMIAANEAITWIPDHLKKGRFGKGLETAPDWNISRSRYWGTPMPIWESASGNGVLRRVIRSIEDLQTWAVDPSAVEKLTDLHREYVDDIEVWVDDARTVKGKRISEVFDCWVESASMPFAQIHYPFENKEEFERSYPAQYVSEYIAQTRAWFYCMHVLSVGIFGSHAFENCLTTGTILAEDGSKMSKSKKNYPDPTLLIEKYGVDSLRLYLMSSTIMKAENLNFSEKGVHDVSNKVITILWNIYGFATLYAQEGQSLHSKNLSVANYQLKSLHVLDRWLLSRIARVSEQVTLALDAYDVVTASRLLSEFTQEFSTWYVRLSRERLKGQSFPESTEIFQRVLVVLMKLFAPFIPFLSERIYQGLTGSTASIHQTDWPKSEDLAPFIDTALENSMQVIQAVTEQTHAARKNASIKVRQPLQSVTVQSPLPRPDEAVCAVFLSEVNVKELYWEVDTTFSVTLDTTLSEALLSEGRMREIVRSVQDLRKQTPDLGVFDSIILTLPEWPVQFESEILRRTGAVEIRTGEFGITKAVDGKTAA